MIEISMYLLNAHDQACITCFYGAPHRCPVGAGLYEVWKAERRNNPLYQRHTDLPVFTDEARP